MHKKRFLSLVQQRGKKTGYGFDGKNVSCERGTPVL